MLFLAIIVSIELFLMAFADPEQDDDSENDDSK